MGLASAPLSAPPYLHCSTSRSAGGPFSLLFSSPLFPVVLLCLFSTCVHSFSFFVFSPLFLFPAAVAIATDAGHSTTAHCKHASDGRIPLSCSVSSGGFSHDPRSHSSSAVLCEDEVSGLPEYYAVVVDSGSTGTRAFVYKVRMEPGSCGDVQQLPTDGEKAEWGNEGSEAADGVFHPLSRAIVQVPAVATRRIGPGIAFFAKRGTGRKKSSEDPFGIENMTEERMRRELLDDEHLLLEKEKAEEEEYRERQRKAARRRPAAHVAGATVGGATNAEAAQERFGRQEDVEESLEKYLGELRTFVLAKVPAEAREQNRAFLFFRGTAGMRALPLEQQQKLLDKVRASLSTWGLMLPAGGAGASVLSGAEEGVLGWVALNQLLGNFRNSDAMLSFAVGGHRLCPAQQQQQDQRQKPEVAPTEERKGNGEAMMQWPEKGRASSSGKTGSEGGRNEDSSNNSPRSNSTVWRAGLVEMGGASAQVVFQLPTEARAANLHTIPYVASPSSSSVASHSHAGNSSSPTAKSAAGQHPHQGKRERQAQQQQQQQPGQAVLRAVEPSERLFDLGETRQYPPVRRHRGPYKTEDFFEVDLCRSRHIVYSKSFLGLGRQHAMMQHIHESVSEAMEERRRQMEQGAAPLPTLDFPVEAAVPCLPADVRVHVNASPAAAATFDEDFSKMVQEEQQDIEEQAAAAAAAEQKRQKQQRQQRSSSVSTAAEKEQTLTPQSESSAEGEVQIEGEEEEAQATARGPPTNTGEERRGSSVFAAAGEQLRDTEAETREHMEEDDDKEKLAKWKKLPRPGVAESVEQDDVLQVLFKGKTADVLQQIESVAAQGTSDGTACMLKMAQTMMRVGRLPVEIHRDIQLYATENFYHFNEYVLQAKGKPDFTVDVFSREGRKLCFLQQVEEVHKRLHPRAAREKAQTACFGLMFMSEFLRRVVGVERDRVLLAVNDTTSSVAPPERWHLFFVQRQFFVSWPIKKLRSDWDGCLLLQLHDVEISWTAAVPMLYMPHVLLHQQAMETNAATAATGAAAAAAAVAEEAPAAASAAAAENGGALKQQHQQRVSTEEKVKDAAAAMSSPMLRDTYHEEL